MDFLVAIVIFLIIIVIAALLLIFMPNPKCFFEADMHKNFIKLKNFTDQPVTDIPEKNRNKSENDENEDENSIDNLGDIIINEFKTNWMDRMNEIDQILLYNYNPNGNLAMDEGSAQNQIPVIIQNMLNFNDQILSVMFYKVPTRTNIAKIKGTEIDNNRIRCVFPLIISGYNTTGVYCEGIKKMCVDNEWIFYDNTRDHCIFNTNKHQMSYLLIVDVIRPSNIPKGIILSEENKLSDITQIR